MARPTYRGQSQAIHVGSSAAAASKFGSHGYRLSGTGSQVVADGASAVVEFATDAIADTDNYWRSGDPTKVTIPSELGGIYMFTADGFVPGYTTGLKFEIVVESGDGEDPSVMAGVYGTDVSGLIHTLPPKSIDAMGGSYRLCELAVIHLKVTNGTGGDVTLSSGSFSGFLMLQSSCHPMDLPCDDDEEPAGILNAYSSPTTSKVWKVSNLAGALDGTPAGWQDPGFDDSGWDAAADVGQIPYFFAATVEDNAGIPVPPTKYIAPIEATVSSVGRGMRWLVRQRFYIAEPPIVADIFYNADDAVALFLNGATPTLIFPPSTTRPGPPSVFGYGLTPSEFVVGWNVLAALVDNAVEPSAWSAGNPTWFNMRLYTDTCPARP